MSRPENRMVMGYFAIEQKHHAAILSLVQPATPQQKMLDPYAGEGEFLEVASKAWNVTPYANELDGERAAKCIERFGATQAVRCDVERLSASTGAFSLGWLNPPYDHDAASKNSKRVEFVYLRHAWKWLQDGAIAMWVVYQQHLTEEALAFFAKNSVQADVWALPGKHLGEYSQVILVAVKGLQANPSALYQDLLEQKEQPRLLTIQPEPVYSLPKPPKLTKFIFAPDVVDEEQGLRLLSEQGAWKNQGFQALLAIPAPMRKIEPIVAPRPGHMALILAAGVANGAILDTAEYGMVALRGKTQAVEELARVEVEADPKDPEHNIKKTTIRLKPTTTLTLLAGNGDVVEMEGDDALLGFIRTNRKALADYLNQQFSPKYSFDMNGLGGWLSKIRLKGKYPVYTAQKHVVGAITKGFETHNSILLAGMMGVGKTLLGSSVAISISAQIVQALRSEIAPNQVILLVAPPHLLDKWEREILSISANSFIQKLNRHEDVKSFMEKAERLGAGIPKIGLVKRDLMKLGAGRELSVVWRDEYVPLWRKHDPVPTGYEPQQRLHKTRVPKCPHCGETIYHERKGNKTLATETWLKAGKRECENCYAPLWQDARDSGSKPRAGEKFPSKNPRMRLDEYIKRQYKDRVYLLIWDEVHESAHSDTGNGLAFNRIANCSKKVLGMTGTPFNGRSSSLFNLQYVLNPRVRERYNWGGSRRFARKIRGIHGFQTIASENNNQRGRAESRWVRDMGVLERVVEERPTYDSESGVYTGTTTYERPFEESPGISPLLVAEMLENTVYFSLKDLGKALPEFEEVAIPVEMDSDIAEQYARTRQQLKDYLIQRRWEGDVGFRGAYLQWALGWQNAPFRPHEVIHNLRNLVTNEKQAITVTTLPSFGEDRLYAKEQKLVEILNAELEAGRPCIVYLRQTGTRDIQPRYEQLIRQHVPLAKPFILKNTVEAERREKVIDMEVAKGSNIIICNPELTKTGLDLVFAPTIIFVEMIFNLSTMMQAAARSYRLNQNHKHCKVLYLYYSETMEQTAVHLMSRKQRAAKLLTGDTGLSGLEALTDGEGSFEAALLEAITQDDVLFDPTTLFKDDNSAIDAEDLSFWNIETPQETAEPITFVPKPVIPEPVQQPEAVLMLRVLPAPDKRGVNLANAVREKLANVALISGEKLAKVQARVIQALECGVSNPADASLMLFEGLSHPDFTRYEVHAEAMTRWLIKYLRSEKALSPDQLADFAAELVALGRAIYAEEPTRLKLEMQPKQSIKPRKKRDLLAIPEDEPANILPMPTRNTATASAKPKQLALFSLHVYS